MRYLPRALLAGGLGFAVSCLAACGGSSGLLSGNQAATLSNHLDAVSSAVNAHNCAQAVNASGKLENSVVHLPSTVNSTVQSNLSQAASTVAKLAQVQCSRTTTSSTTATTATKTTSSTSSTATSSSTSSSTSTSTVTSSVPATPTSPAGSTSTTSNGGGAGLPGGGGNGP